MIKQLKMPKRKKRKQINNNNIKIKHRYRPTSRWQWHAAAGPDRLLLHMLIDNMLHILCFEYMLTVSMTHGAAACRAVWTSTLQHSSCQFPDTLHVAHVDTMTAHVDYMLTLGAVACRAVCSRHSRYHDDSQTNYILHILTAYMLHILTEYMLHICSDREHVETGCGSVQGSLWRSTAQQTS